MARLDEQILSWNPWWRDPGAIRNDPHLAALSASPFQWDPALLESLPLAPGDTHTLRGPRQAGKTTLVKRLLRRLLRAGERRVLYFGFDLHREASAIYDVIRRAKELHPEPEGPWYFFLDEVTSLDDWQNGVKVAWDQGLTRDDFLLLTGSSAHDLKTGAERLPGRRGKGADYLHLPMSFRDFAVQVMGISLPAECVELEQYLTENGRKLARQLYLSFDELERALRTYSSVGGYPSAAREHLLKKHPDETLRTLWHAIAGDVARSGRSQAAAAKLLEEVAVSLGSPLKWSGTSKAMGMASSKTAREYVEFMAEAFALLIVYFWDLSGKSFQPSKQRKVYYLDPLLGEIAASIMPGARRPPEDGLVENLVAIALFRSSAHSLMQASAVPGAVGYWRSSNHRELDFVVPSSTFGRGGRIPLEVKGDNQARLSYAKGAIERSFGSGLIASRSVLDLQGDVVVIPAAVLLAGLAEAPERKVAFA